MVKPTGGGADCEGVAAPEAEPVARDARPLTPSVSDEVLRRARQGDREALADLFRAFQPGLLRFLRSLATSEADDVAGQVWIEVARSLARFEGAADDFRRWLYTIARRRMIDAFRVGGRRLEDYVSDPPELSRSEGPEDAGSELEWAESVLRRLPPNQAEVVLLRTIAGFTVAEVATITGRTPGAVRVLAHRGLARVLEILTEADLLPRGVTPVTSAAME
jgi:RNA polymerase sigma-70 factor (ECF subfamily)